MRSKMMKKSVLLIFLAAVLPGCNDSGLAPPEDEPGPRFRDEVILIPIIPGTLVYLRTMDSVGTIKKSFARSESVFLKYSFVNRTGSDQKVTMGMSYPFARFFVMQGRDTVADSFAGLAFAAVPLKATLKNGDSLTASWKVDPAKVPLPPGSYLTSASSSFALVGLGVPDNCWAMFEINP